MPEGGHWFRTSSYWCRKVVTDSGLVAAGAELVVAVAGRWSLMQDSARWSKAGSCWCRTGSYWCRKVVVGAGLVAASPGKWSPVQEWELLLQGSGLRCKKVVVGAVSKGIRLDFLN